MAPITCPYWWNSSFPAELAGPVSNSRIRYETLLAFDALRAYPGTVFKEFYSDRKLTKNPPIFSRRSLLSGLGASSTLALAGCASLPRGENRQPFFNRTSSADRELPSVQDTDLALAYGPRPNEQFPIPAVNLNEVPERFYRRRIRYDSREKPGTIIVDTGNFYLYHIERGGYAWRYGVGLGRAGFAWSGRAKVRWKQKWPKWTPPEEMIARRPELEKWSVENGGMPPGPTNPLGSRALYIFEGNVDTLYRIHGTPEHRSIGKAVSSGCVRMIHQDVIHLYDRVRPGSDILVY